MDCRGRSITSRNISSASSVQWALRPVQENAMPMTMLEKELVALAISVAAGCRPCVTHHLVEVRKAGADDAAIEQAVAGAVRVRKTATEGMRRHALGLDPVTDGCGCGAADPLAELIALGAALAVNCTAGIDRHLAAARSLGIPQDRLDEVLGLASMIRSRAISHAEARLGATGQGNWGEAPKAARCC
ncbi:hypothetical protein amb1837 [Paramagnetospirillum magneticum AMB-1]|uniref:Carboxymuconolactone decarboxylase-like domain-containing protein n=2 Tax=Paramagnetospirillum magneticum TaxID=84159 RepID=Q2W684_PARM1|nr:hypothetical protein amb1837 [Paramagnetospirillum magneticum AMB-1]